MDSEEISISENTHYKGYLNIEVGIIQIHWGHSSSQSTRGSVRTVWGSFETTSDLSICKRQWNCDGNKRAGKTCQMPFPHVRDRCCFSHKFHSWLYASGWSRAYIVWLSEWVSDNWSFLCFVHGRLPFWGRGCLYCVSEWTVSSVNGRPLLWDRGRLILCKWVRS